MKSGRPVSVIIPTYHRPNMLRRAVASVLAQEVPEGTLEVIIAVSDRESSEDRAVAIELAADHRVRFVVADRLGPGAARNAAMAVAKGALFAFTDDDCEAAPGWLTAGIEGLQSVDIVQGRTVPLEPRTTRMMRTISVEQLSYLWQTCNLFVRRSTVERTGGFDQDWNPTGRPGRHWGEDAVWGWRLVRGGATYIFEPGAEVKHAVEMQTIPEILERKLALRYFPQLIRRTPEVRQHLYGRYFLNRAHARLTVSLAMLAAGGAAAASGAPKLAVAGTAAAVATAVWPPRKVSEMLVSTANELVSYVIVLYGSIRHRRLVL